MQTICDVVLTGMTSGIGQKSGKEWYRVGAVIVGCPELPLLAGTRLDKFVNEDIYKELCTLTTDRFYLPYKYPHSQTYQVECQPVTATPDIRQ